MNKPLVVLWFGGGQDSTDLLYRIVYDAGFRRRYVGDAHLLVLMADTGNEYPETVAHVNYVRGFCLQHGIEFYLIENWMGYHSQSWQSLSGQFVRNDNIMSVAFPKTCTDNLKIQPNYRFLSDYLREAYGFTQPGKRVFYEYQKHYGKLRSIIGFAKGEESRCGRKPQTELFPDLIDDPRPVWMKQNVEHLYPLVELRVDRAGCQASIAGFGHPVPPPSNCMKCPFAAPAELLYLHRHQPDTWQEWVEDEARKIAKNALKGTARNLGVKGEKLLPESLAEAQRQYGHWTNDQLREYRMSHGHGVKSKI